MQVKTGIWSPKRNPIFANWYEVVAAVLFAAILASAAIVTFATYAAVWSFGTIIILMRKSKII